MEVRLYISFNVLFLTLIDGVIIRLFSHRNLFEILDCLNQKIKYLLKKTMNRTALRMTLIRSRRREVMVIVVF